MFFHNALALLNEPANPDHRSTFQAEKESVEGINDPMKTGFSRNYFEPIDPNWASGSEPKQADAAVSGRIIIKPIPRLRTSILIVPVRKESLRVRNIRTTPEKFLRSKIFEQSSVAKRVVFFLKQPKDTISLSRLNLPQFQSGYSYRTPNFRKIQWYILLGQRGQSNLRVQARTWFLRNTGIREQKWKKVLDPSLTSRRISYFRQSPYLGNGVRPLLIIPR